MKRFLTVVTALLLLGTLALTALAGDMLDDVRKKGAIRSLKDLAGKKIATAKGSTAERNLKAAVPKAKIVLYDDYNQAALGRYTKGKSQRLRPTR